MRQLVILEAVERESYILQKQQSSLIKMIRVGVISTLKVVYKKRKALCN